MQKTGKKRIEALPPTGIVRHSHTIELGNSHARLEEDVLRAHMEPAVLKSRSWDFPTLSLAGYKDGVLELANEWQGECYRLSITVEHSRLLVGCSCGADDALLCLHAYKALHHLTRFGSEGFFRAFLPGGEASLALEYPRWFSTEWKRNELHIEPKKEVGELFIPGSSGIESSLPQAMGLPGVAGPLRGKQEAVACYFIMPSPRGEMLPVLVPCLGRLNKEGTYVKSFDTFLSAVAKEWDHLLTEDQRRLNGLCLQLFKAAEALPGRLLPEEGLPNAAKLEELFGLWKAAAVMLQAQPHVFLHYLWRQRNLRGKPSRRSTRMVSVGGATPCLSFRVRRTTDCAQLKMEVNLQTGVLLTLFDTDIPFFIRHGGTLYLLSSLRDVAVAEWMEGVNGTVTVFPPHEAAFKSGVLLELQKHYEVKTAAKREPLIIR